MSRDDALLSIERHATSKITDVGDIERVATLGFRGEALAAVASVSRMRLVTCRKGEDTGTELVVTGGKIQDVRGTGCPVGTSVEVRDLFFNVPARRKFLRAYQTEMARVRDTFIVQALAGYSLGQADIFRKAMGKKIPEVMKKERRSFIAGAKKKEFSAETAAHVTTQVDRTLYYERDLSSSATWFNNAIGMGSSEGPGHDGEYDYQHINNILSDLSGYGYTTHTNHQSGGSTSNLTNISSSRPLIRTA